ncbi:MAG TPA: threonine ammonia-lyase, biosynthetic [Victivallales bacterium]|nr:threonine ammonia-lyase, biosynthetic [Victivallales bacterium]
MFTNYIKKILDARIYDLAIETPINHMELLSDQYSNNIYVKREDLQPVHSFKIRGAYNKIDKLSDTDKEKGVIAASAGNHAQGVALAAMKKKIKATIVMPKTTPEIKVDAVRSYGANVELFGDNFDEAYDYACKLQKEHKYVFIHPYDDKDVIAGQGTIGMEIARQVSIPPEAIFIPVGGGGLISGIAYYIKYLWPEVKIIGVESEDSACLYQALKKNRRVILDSVGIFADGVAVKQIGKEPYKIAKKYVDEVITVKTDEICAAIKDLFNDNRSIAEPAGALSIAGLKKYIEKYKITDKNLLAIETGANVNFDRLRLISERADLGENKEALFAVTIKEEPGSFKSFCKTLANYNITEFNYRYSDNEKANIFVGLQLSDITHKENIINNIKEDHYSVIDLSDNELAKLHARHMVGGHLTKEMNEEIFRFQFPERSGALADFLNQMKDNWNITMFHYRNHGTDYGRVFLGIQIPPEEQILFNKFLKQINYRYHREKDNPVYSLFLN